MLADKIKHAVFAAHYKHYPNDELNDIQVKSSESLADDVYQSRPRNKAQLLIEMFRFNKGIFEDWAIDYCLKKHGKYWETLQDCVWAALQERDYEKMV